MPKYMTYPAREMMVRAGRFVDELNAPGVEFFAGVPVKFSCGCPVSNWTYRTTWNWT